VRNFIVSIFLARWSGFIGSLARITTLHLGKILSGCQNLCTVWQMCCAQMQKTRKAREERCGLLLLLNSWW